MTLPKFMKINLKQFDLKVLLLQSYDWPFINVTKISFNENFFQSSNNTHFSSYRSPTKTSNVSTLSPEAIVKFNETFEIKIFLLQIRFEKVLDEKLMIWNAFCWCVGLILGRVRLIDYAETNLGWKHDWTTYLSSDNKVQSLCYLSIKLQIKIK